jgi:outer membrane receptor protein involved in Fe transport
MERLSRPLTAAFVAILFLYGFLDTSLAQNMGSEGANGTVAGVVVDGTRGETIPTATVALWSAQDSSLVTGAITNDDGRFSIDRVPVGSYYVRVSFVGYMPKIVSDVSITSDNHRVDLEEIELSESTAEMDEVQVSAEREYMEVRADKTVYNPQNQPVTAGGSARNVLEEIPSIDVDMEGNISLRGNQNVAIYLNGKPAPMSGDALTSFLEGLSSEDIESIEVIPNPSARYEPEGMSGIINIVLAKNKDRGWGGGISAGVSTNTRYNGSGNVHYGSGPWSLFSTYSLRYDEDESSGTRFRTNRFIDPLTHLDQESIEYDQDLSHTFNTSIDYELSRLNTLSFTSVLSSRGSDEDEQTSYLESDAYMIPLDRYNRQSLSDRSNLGMDYRLDFRRVIEPRAHELTAELRYEHDWENDGDRYFQRDLALDGGQSSNFLEEEQHVDESETEQEASAEVTYVRPLGEIGSLDVGYKGDYERQNSDYYSESLNLQTDQFEPDDELNNQFLFDEQIHAAFGILATEWNIFNLQLGLRAERALTTFNQQTLDEAFDNSYFSFFPSAHMSIEPSPSNTFRLSYSKRVRRPNTWQLNPFGDYDDPTFRRMGNPYLTPEYTHSFEVGYSRLGNLYTISLAPYFRHTVDEISWHENITDEGVSILTFENFSTENSYGLELIGSLTLGEWLKANGSLNGFKRVTDATNVQSSLSNSALGYMARMRLTATIVEGLNFQVSQFYRSGHDIPGGRIGSFTRTNAALQQDLFGRRASLSVRASDLLGNSSFSVSRDTERFYQEFTRTRDRRGVQLTFRYTFGQQDQNRRQQEPRPDNGGGDEGGYGDM